MQSNHLFREVKFLPEVTTLWQNLTIKSYHKSPNFNNPNFTFLMANTQISLKLFL